MTGTAAPSRGEQEQAQQGIRRRTLSVERLPRLKRNYDPKELGVRAVEVAMRKRIALASLKLFPE